YLEDVGNHIILLESLQSIAQGRVTLCIVRQCCDNDRLAADFSRQESIHGKINSIVQVRHAQAGSIGDRWHRRRRTRNREAAGKWRRLWQTLAGDSIVETPAFPDGL